jgi:glucose/arabinose dehydrogenase
MVTAAKWIAGLLLVAALHLAAGESKADQENKYYRMITIPTPENVQFESGAMVFLGPDKLACSTRIGDIWIAEGIMSENPQPKWTQFAGGLHEVLGLAEKDGWIYATQRGEVTRLKDTNDDGRADVLETVNDDWGISGDYHEFAFGSKFDKDGNMYVVLCLTGSFSSENPYRGWALKITPEGKAIPICSGLRSPGGLGFNAKGEIFYTDNQGPWNGTSKLQMLKPGMFLGHPGGNVWYDKEPTKEAIAAAGMKKPADPKSDSRIYDEQKRIPELMLPALYFPYNKMGQSASGIACDVSGGKFGPFKEQLFVGDQTHSTVMRCFLEMTADGFYQGVCFPFRQGFDSGSLAQEFAPDGSLFNFQTDRGWGSRGGKPFALQRLVWTGETPFEIHEMRAKPDGFEITFTKPCDPASVEKTEAYTIETYIVKYQAAYGSPEVDQTKPTIKSVKVAADKMSAHIVVDGLVEGHIHELHCLGVKSAEGEPLLHDAAYYTLWRIPKQ